MSLVGDLPISASSSASIGGLTANTDYATTINFGAGYVDAPFNPVVTPQTSSTATAATGSSGMQGGSAGATAAGGLLASLDGKSATVVWVLGGMVALVVLAGAAYFLTHKSG